MNVDETLSDISSLIKKVENNIKIYKLAEFKDEAREKLIISDIESIESRSNILIKFKEAIENPEATDNYIMVPMTKEQKSQLKYLLELFKVQALNFDEIIKNHDEELTDSYENIEDVSVELPSINDEVKVEDLPSINDEITVNELPSITESEIQVIENTEVPDMVAQYTEDTPVEIGNENIVENTKDQEERVISFNRPKILSMNSKAA